MGQYRIHTPADQTLLWKWKSFSTLREPFWMSRHNINTYSSRPIDVALFCDGIAGVLPPKSHRDWSRATLWARVKHWSRFGQPSVSFSQLCASRKFTLGKQPEGDLRGDSGSLFVSDNYCLNIAKLKWSLCSLIFLKKTSHGWFQALGLRSRPMNTY